MKLRVLPEAVRDADEAAAWYERHVAGLGRDFLDRVNKTFERILTAPDAGSLLGTTRPEEIVRGWRLKRFPYLMVYQSLPSALVVLAVAHERRHPQFWGDRIQH